jgi:hypothetical protein
LLIVGGILLGKAKQRRSDEEAAGELLIQAQQAIVQLKDAIASDQIDGSQARAIFDRDILGQFRQQIGTLKTKSVVQSRLTNQTRDLEKVYNDLVTPQILAQEARKAAGLADVARRQSNALNFSRQIPEFATGGTTRGGLVLLHPGEKILNRQQQSAVRAMAGPDVFERAGVPGPSRNRTFDIGGTMPSGGINQPIEITMQAQVIIGKSDATKIVVVGASTPQGRAVTVKNVNDARTNREL